MSGIIAPSMLTLDIENIQSSLGNYKIISFPNRVKITSVSFTVNSAAAGAIENARVWNLYLMGGSSYENPSAPWSDFVFQLFGYNEKPVIDNAVSQFVSTIGYPTSENITLNASAGINISPDAGVLKPGDYVTAWIESSDGDFEDIVWEDTKAVITICYEATTEPTIYELIQKYPQLD